MTDAPLAMRSDMTRFVPLRHLTEIVVFLIFFFVTVRYPGTQAISALTWLALLAGLMMLRRAELAATLLRWWPLLLATTLAPASAIWSDSPAIAGRYGAQLLVAAFAGVFLARTLAPWKLVAVLFLSMLLVCVLSILAGRKDISAEGLVLIGVLGSKNQMAMMAYLLFVSGLGVLVERRALRVLRAATLPGMAIGAYIVATTASATAQLLIVVSPPLFLGLCVLHRLPPAGRVAAVFALLLTIAPLAAIAPEIARGVEDFTINVLHKDPGLTGRDYLWARAIDLIELRPILGYGFQVMWLGDSPETLGLLRWANISDGRTFNFHNTYLQYAVDTGLVGAGLFVATIALAVLAAARQYILRPSVATTLIFVLLLQMLARSMTETLLVSFSSSTVLLYVCIAYAFWRPAPSAVSQPGAPPTAGGYAPVGWAMVERPRPPSPKQPAPPRVSEPR